MKTPEIKGFVDVSLVDWEGKVSAVIFLPNCNFRCPFCYNAQLVLTPEKMPTVPFEEIQQYLENSKGWLDAATITGGEPTLHEGLSLLCQKLKDLGLKVKLDTNGTNPTITENLIKQGLVDYVALDIKAPLTREKYSKATNTNTTELLERIEKTIEIFFAGQVDYEFRTTLVPTIHEPADIERICQKIKGCKKYVLQNFKGNVETINPTFKSLKPFTQEQMQVFRDTASKIVSNVSSRE
jgi:pyruvate formate lyase activating enzyme